MSSIKGGVQFIGPVDLGAGATKTYAHDQGHKAKCIEVLNAEGQPVPPSVIAAAQPSAASVTINNPGGAPVLGLMIRIEWDTYSTFDSAALPGSVFV